MRNKEYLVAIRPSDAVLALETMFFADEVRDARSEIEGIPVDATFTKREVDTAKLLIESMAAPFEPKNYNDTYRERVEELIERKRNGEKIVIEPVGKKPEKVLDLADALARSVEAAKGRHRAGRGIAGGHSERSAGSSQPPRPKQDRRDSQPARAAGADLSELRKSDLYEKAAELDLPGRSKMSRDELEDAVRSATASRRRRAS